MPGRLSRKAAQPLSFYTGLVDRLPASTALAVREQIINAFNSIDHLLAGHSRTGNIPALCAGCVAADARCARLPAESPSEPVTASLLRASLVQQLGLFGDEDVIKMCRQNFDNYLKNPGERSA